MIRVKDHKQQHLFDPWDFLSPKRRKMLDESWPGLFRAHILEQLPVDEFALVFHESFGRPTKELYTVLGSLLLQQCFDLTDPQTVEQLAYNIQWHYALNISEESDSAKYLCEKTLWSMRQIATEMGLHDTAFENITAYLAEVFKVNDDKQRIDSVHIHSNMRRLGRIGIFVTAVDKFLTNLNRQHKPLWESVDAELIEKYQGTKARQCFGLVKPSQSAATLSAVASDLYRLVIQFDSHPEVTEMYSFKLLKRIVNEQCEVSEDGSSVEVKPAKQIRSDSLQNPSDPDATYSGHKGQGYQVQIMETYTETEDPKQKAKELNLVTHVEVEKACQGDSQALLPAVESTLLRGLGPAQVTADSLYGSDENIGEAAQMGVEVVSPAMGTEQREEAKLSDFEFCSDGHVAQCPAGHKPVVKKKKKTRFSQGFDLSVCDGCPLVESCPAKKGSGHYYLRYTEKEMRIAKRRAEEKSDEFKDRYRWRAGVEATMSQYDRLTGVKHLRVRGFAAVAFSAVMKAIGLNIMRATAVMCARRASGGAGAGALGLCQAILLLLLLFKEQFGELFKPINRPARFLQIVWPFGHRSRMLGI
jgi:hypothetical protein